MRPLQVPHRRRQRHRLPQDRLRLRPPQPLRAGLLRPNQPLESYTWSSYGQYLKAPGRRVSWLRVDRLLGEWAIPKDSPAGRRRFGQCMEQRRHQENPKSDCKAVERGWFLGDPEFKKELLAQMHQRRGDHYPKGSHSGS